MSWLMDYYRASEKWTSNSSLFTCSSCSLFWSRLCSATIFYDVFNLTGFLKRNRKGKVDKKKKTSTASVVNKDDVTGDDATTKEMGSDGEDNRKSETPTPEVDDEGFSKQPATKTGPSDPWSDFNQPSKNFYSSSDDSGF